MNRTVPFMVFAPLLLAACVDDARDGSRHEPDTETASLVTPSAGERHVAPVGLAGLGISHYERTTEGAAETVSLIGADGRRLATIHVVIDGSFHEAWGTVAGTLYQVVREGPSIDLFVDGERVNGVELDSVSGQDEVERIADEHALGFAYVSAASDVLFREAREEQGGALMHAPEDLAVPTTAAAELCWSNGELGTIEKASQSIRADYFGLGSKAWMCDVAETLVNNQCANGYCNECKQVASGCDTVCLGAAIPGFGDYLCIAATKYGYPCVCDVPDPPSGDGDEGGYDGGGDDGSSGSGCQDWDCGVTEYCTAGGSCCFIEDDCC